MTQKNDYDKCNIRKNKRLVMPNLRSEFFIFLKPRLSDLKYTLDETYLALQGWYGHMRLLLKMMQRLKEFPLTTCVISEKMNSSMS